MTIREARLAVKLKLDKTDSLDYTSFLPEEIDFWLYQAYITKIKTWYTGNNSNKKGFEQTQKRTDDLRTLVTESIIDTQLGVFKANSYTAELPIDYWFTLGEEATIAYNPNVTNIPVLCTSVVIENGKLYKVTSGTVTYNTVTYQVGQFITGSIYNACIGTGYLLPLTSKRVGITELTTNRYRDYIDNPFGQHIFHYNSCRPIRLFVGDSVELIGDGQYDIPKYQIRYLRKPAKIGTFEVISGDILPGIVYTVVGGYAYYNNVLYTNTQFTGLVGITTFDTDGNTAIVTMTQEFETPSHTHDEIVNTAVNMIIENIGDTTRYQTTTIENSKME